MQTENTYVETDLGNIALNPRGEYLDEASYEYLDIVSYKGGSYMCLAELTKTVSGIAPVQSKNTEHWQMLTLPGGLTSDYITMHDDVVNKAKQVETSRAAAELSQQEVEAAQADVSQMRQDTQEAAEEAASSRDSAAGYAQSAEASRTAAKESEDNINAQVVGFDAHVAEKTSAAEISITEARRAAVSAVSTKQDNATQAVTDEGNKQIKNVEDAGTEQVGKAKSAGASAVSAADAAGVSAVNTVKTQQTASIKAVADEGTQQVTAVNTAGSTQASIIETKGADQVKAIQEAGENALQNISDGVDKGLSEEGKAADAKATGEAISNLTEDLDNKIEHVGGYKEYDIGTPSVGTYWNKSAKKQLESETYQSFNPISLKAGTYHYENMSGSFTFYEDTDGNWIPIGKYSASGNGDVVITNDTTMYITEMQKSGVFVGAKLYSGDITQKESNWFKNPKYDIDNINSTLESLSDSVNDIKSIDGSVIKEYCIYVSTTGSDTSGDGSEEKPFATIYHANETITDNSYAKRYRIIVLPGTYTDLQDKYTGIAQTSKYQGVITKPWVTYESKSGNPEDTIIEWNGSTGLENPIRSDIVEKCAFHIVSLPRTFTAIKGFTIKSKNTRYAMHCESSGMGIQGEWLIENCIFDWGGCPNISDDTGRFPAIGIGMSPCEKGTIKFCKIVTTTVETMLVHDGKNKDGNSAVILGAELNFIKCDLGTGRLQFQSIYPKSGEINAKTNNVCNLISCTQINNLYSYISSLNSDDEMVWRVYGKDCDFASYGNMSDYVYKIGTANNVSN